MLTPEGRRCDMRECKGLGIHYGMNTDGNIGDLCEDDFVIYNVYVSRGALPKPYLECSYCDTKVHMLPAQFTKAMKEIDNREKKRSFSPKFACPACSRKPGFLSVASLSIGKVVFAEAI